MPNVAAIDIGTNSFHLIVVKTDSEGNFEIIDREKEVIRLSEGSIGDIKIIKKEAIERAIKTLSRFKKIAESHNANLRAVATSAVREALNKNEFKELVFNSTGIEVEVISGTEEARLIYLGILKAVPVYDKYAFCFDIGGGSTEFVLGKEEKIIYSNSLKLGAVRLTDRFFPDRIITPDAVDRCRKWVKGELNPVLRKLENQQIETVVGSSGTVQAAALMIMAKNGVSTPSNGIVNNFTFSYSDLKDIEVKILQCKSSEERKNIPGLDPKRADIIQSGIIILSTIMESFDLTEVTVSGYALREGIVINTLQRLDSKPNPKLFDIRLESVKYLSNKCNYDKKHCNHVAELSKKVFTALKELHQLDFNTLNYLEAAAILHDIGYHISHTQHHRHSLYIIKNSELLGYNESEIAIIANIARYHRKSHPKEKHKDFSELNDKNKEIVRKLSAILRITDACDRTHQQNIKDIEVKISNEVIFILYYTKEYPEIELWSLERRKLLFKEVFGKEILFIAEKVN